MTGSAEPHRAPAGGLLKRLIFWDFPRASWQYDLVVGLILIFVFATPREWFHDQPKGSSVVLISSDRGTDHIFIAPELLEQSSEGQRITEAEKLIREKMGKSRRVVRLEPIRDESEHEIKGFLAYTRP